ncbi:MAG: hypothetical protein BZ135_03250 [Methanosphaera sp. rholeuAM6]|nr:MAG: hypothetical protein BZ135_03250 [Methanosphaera sp. rholeuAM6]
MKIKQVLLFVTLLVMLVGVVSADDVSENITSNEAAEVVQDLSTASDNNAKLISQIDVNNEKTDNSPYMDIMKQTI